MSERPNIEELKKVASEVGEYAGMQWKVILLSGEPVVVRFDYDEDEDGPGSWDSSFLGQGEAAHIAACDPKTIAEMCAYVERLEKLCEEAYSFVNSYNHEHDDEGLAERLRPIVL